MLPQCLSELNVERKFEVYDIRWVIENFRLFTCGDDWSIQSPEFIVRGFHVTKWLITLSSTPNKHHPRSVVFILKRCDSTAEPDNVCVKWRLNISTSGCDEEITIERFCDFVIAKEYKENLKNSIEAIRLFESDLMMIRCKMIVYSRVENGEFEPCCDRGKSFLSESLLDLFRGGHGCDLQLKIDGKSILAHKAIACTRIERLNHLLEDVVAIVGDECREIDVIDAPYLNHEAMVKIMEYAYSGDLTHVLGEPSLAILDNVQILDMHQLKKCYAAKELVFRTSLNVQETRFTWIIEDFFDKYEELIVSPDLFDTSTTWRLHFFPGKENCSDYFSAFAENVGGAKLGNVCAEFALTDECGRSVFAKLLRRAAYDFRPLRFNKFIRKSTLRYLLMSSDLRLTMKLKLSKGTPYSYIEKQDISVVTNSYKIDSFDLLSDAMQDLLDFSDFSDLLLCSNGDCYRIHRCIISSRCCFLSTLLRDVKSDTNCVIVQDIEPDILSLILYYIYGGIVLETEDSLKMTELRKAAVEFNLSLLAELCEDALKKAVK